MSVGLCRDWHTLNSWGLWSSRQVIACILYPVLPLTRQLMLSKRYQPRYGQLRFQLLDEAKMPFMADGTGTGLRLILFGSIIYLCWWQTWPWWWYLVLRLSDEQISHRRSFKDGSRNRPTVNIKNKKSFVWVCDKAAIPLSGFGYPEQASFDPIQSFPTARR